MKKKSNCIDCGVPVAFEAKRCMSCFNKVLRTCLHCKREMPRDTRQFCDDYCRSEYFKTHDPDLFCKTCNKPMVDIRVKGGSYKSCSEECAKALRVKNTSEYNKLKKKGYVKADLPIERIAEQEEFCGHKELAQAIRKCDNLEEVKQVRSEYHGGKGSMKSSSLESGARVHQ